MIGGKKWKLPTNWGIGGKTESAFPVGFLYNLISSYITEIPRYLKFNITTLDWIGFVGLVYNINS